jgi:hypothetical protein
MSRTIKPLGRPAAGEPIFNAANRRRDKFEEKT